MCDKIKNKAHCICDFIYENRSKILMFLSVIFHISDIVTDIVVTNDLYNEKSSYFIISLGILIFSFVGSSLLSLGDNKFSEIVRQEKKIIIQEPKINIDVLFASFIYFVKMIYYMILDITQINYFIDCYNFIFFELDDDDVELKDRLVRKRMKESLLESGPEALLQLFIILNQSNSNTFMDLITYYISIKMSLLSLTYTLVSMDYFYLERLLVRLKIRDVSPSYLSKYLLNLIIFRFTEVFSRVGLLACIGKMYNGYYLFLFIFTDFITLNVLNVFKRCIRYKVEKCEFSTNSLKLIKRTSYVQHYRGIKRKILETQYNGNDGLIYNDNGGLIYNDNDGILDNLTWRDTPLIIYSAYKILLFWKIYKKDKVKNIFKLKTIIQQDILPIYERSMDIIRVQDKILHNYKKEIYDSKIWFEMMSVTLFVDNIKNLGVYYRPLSYQLYRDIIYYFEAKKYEEIEFSVTYPDSNRWWNRISMHFISKYINNTCISGLLIYNLLTETNSVTIVIISISSMICYLINIMSLSLITKWNNGFKFVEIVTEPMLKIKCKTICCCYSTKKKDNIVEETKTIEDGECVANED